MKDSRRRSNPPGAPGVQGATSSWADETLPLGLRKELLARELQKLAAPKAKGKAQTEPNESQAGLTGRKAEEQSGERPR